MIFVLWVAFWTAIACSAGVTLWASRVLERIERPLDPPWLWWSCWGFFALLFMGGVFGGISAALALATQPLSPEWNVWLIAAIPLCVTIMAVGLCGLRIMITVQGGRIVLHRKWLVRQLVISRAFAWCALAVSYLALAFISIPGTVIFGSALVMNLGARARSQRVTLLWMLSAATRTSRPLHIELRAWADVSRGRQRRRLEQAAQLLEQGRPLSDALDLARLLPAHDFPRLHLAEKIGTLPETLADLAREETARLQPVEQPTSPFVMAAYLTLLPGAVILIVGFVMYYIIPKFKKIFEDFNTELPEMTIWLVRMSDNFINFWYLFAPPFMFVALAAMIGGTLSLYFPWLEFRRRFIDPWAVSLAMTDVMRNLAHQIRCQRPLPDALRDVGHYCINWTVRTRLNRVREMVAGGRDLWVELADARLINRRELAVLQSAHRTGHPDWGLLELANRRELAWSAPFVWLMTVLRGAVPLILGFIVGWICIALFIPLLKLLNDLS